MLVRNIVLLLVLTIPLGCKAQGQSTSGPINIVEQFIAAFNAQDPDRMAQYVTDDIQWLSVNGPQLSVETNGKTALLDSMSRYFKSCASCRSKLFTPIVLGHRVSVIEQASWEHNGERRSQKSLAVYELAGQAIRRVYYFPAD